MLSWMNTMAEIWLVPLRIAVRQPLFSVQIMTKCVKPSLRGQVFSANQRYQQLPVVAHCPKVRLEANLRNIDQRSMSRISKICRIKTKFWYSRKALGLSLTKLRISKLNSSTINQKKSKSSIRNSDSRVPNTDIRFIRPKVRMSGSHPHRLRM